MIDKDLIERGADCVGGRLILDNVVLGTYNEDSFSATPEGLELLKTAPPEAKPQTAPPEAKPQTEATAKPKAPAKPKKPVAEKSETPPAAPVEDLLAGLGDDLSA